MPTQMTFAPDPASGALTVRVRQVLRVLGETTLGNSLQFLHTEVTDDGAQDWGDGVIDYAWYRSQGGDSPDAAPGSHTGMVRIADYTLRRYAYRSSVADPQRTALSDVRHTAAGGHGGQSRQRLAPLRPGRDDPRLPRPEPGHGRSQAGEDHHRRLRCRTLGADRPVHRPSPLAARRDGRSGDRGAG